MKKYKRLGIKIINFIRIKLSQKKYMDLTYLYKNKGSDKLIIIFSAFGTMGQGPRFNYIETLKNEPIDQLFILDSFGYNKAGSYYLGENGDWFVPNEIIQLINHIKSKKKYSKIYTLGSSKGGTCSLYYGLILNADVIFSGAPQYLVGDYLNLERHRPILQALQGDTSVESVDRLNNYLRRVIIENSGKRHGTTIFLHYSPNEEMYEDHILKLRNDLLKYGYNLHEDNDYTYSDHQDVGKYFVPYIKKVLKHLDG